MVRVGLTEIKPSVEHRVLEDDSELARTVSGVGGSCGTLARRGSHGCFQRRCLPFTRLLTVCP